MATPAETLALAAQYHATGNLALAEEFANVVLADDPNHAEALHLLGLIAQQKGNRDQAMVYLNRSLTANGANPFTWQHMGDVLLAAGDLRSGITYYEQALRLKPDFAEGYNTLGIAWQSLGDWARAVPCFRQAIRLAPSFVPPHNNLGNALRAQGQKAEAVEVFKQALRLAPDNPDITYNLGNACHDLGDLDQAVACYRQVLRLKPAYAAEVSNSLATALKEQGLIEEAVAQFRETWKLRPDHAMASYNLSELAAAGHFRFTPDELERVKAYLASGRCSPLERVLSAFAAAAVLDQQGAYDEAFSYYREANDLKRRHLQERKLAFDARAHEALIDRIMAVHSPSYFERVKKWGTSTELPIFIVGLPRAGATLVEATLAGHPQVFAGGDIGNVYQFIAQSAADKNANPYSTQLLPNLRAARKGAADYLQRLAQLSQGAARATVRNLENFLHLGVIATLFSRARIIHCRRDPVDVCLSCYFHNFRDMSFAWSLDEIAAYHRSYERLMAHWSRVLPVPIHEVRYEELVQNHESVARGLLSFCGLEWDARCLTFDQRRRAGQRASAVPAPLSAHRIGRWRHYRSHLGPLLQALGLTQHRT